MIAITQPRRVAAVSLSARVMSELNLSSHSSLVAHQIRYSSTTSPDTAIKFMTDGVLLRELASDFLLSRYSVVIVDEAHERAVNTDVLIGVLSRVAKLREKLWRDGKDEVRPLRLVIMSATLRIDDLNANRTLFSTPPPVIHIPGRQHPVTSHFSRKTGNDYVSEAYKKVCKIHARLPVGAILVFLTGQAEIQALCRKLERRYSAKIRHRSNGKDRTLEVAQKGVSAGTTLPVEGEHDRKAFNPADSGNQRRRQRTSILDCRTTLLRTWTMVPRPMIPRRWIVRMRVSQTSKPTRPLTVGFQALLSSFTAVWVPSYHGFEDLI